MQVLFFFCIVKITVLKYKFCNLYKKQYEILHFLSVNAIFLDMYLFLLIAIPVCLFIFFHSQENKARFAVPALFGFICAMIVCVIDEFFIFSIHHFTEVFMANFAYLFLSEIFIPSIILCAIYIPLSKNPAQIRAKSIIPLLLGFYLIYMPYKVITGKENAAFFQLFIKPVIIICFIQAACSLAGLAVQSLKTGKKQLAIPYFSAVFIACLLPSLTETIWYMKISDIVWIVLAVIQIALAVFLQIGSQILHKDA